MHFDTSLDAFVLTFDETMESSSNFASIILADENGNTVLASKVLKNNTLTISPKNGWKRGATYTVTLPQGALVNYYGYVNEQSTFTFTCPTNTATSKPVISLTPQNDIYTTFVGDTSDGWKPIIYPADADCSFTYSSSNPDVAYVDENGSLIRVSAGFAQIAIFDGCGTKTEFSVIVYNEQKADFVVKEVKYVNSSVMVLDNEGALWQLIANDDNTLQAKKVLNDVTSFDYYSTLTILDKDGILAEIAYNFKSGGSIDGIYYQNNLGTFEGAVKVKNVNNNIYLLFADGSVKVKGSSNSYGQLGIGSYDSASDWTDALISNVSDIWTDGCSAMFLKTTGELYLAGGQNIKNSTPTLVATGIAEFVDMGDGNLYYKTKGGDLYEGNTGGSTYTSSLVSTTHDKYYHIFTKNPSGTVFYKYDYYPDTSNKVILFEDITPSKTALNLVDSSSEAETIQENQIVLKFDDAISSVTSSSIFFVDSSGNSIEFYTKVFFNELVITPKSDFTYGETYTVTLAQNAVKTFFSIGNGECSKSYIFKSTVPVSIKENSFTKETERIAGTLEESITFESAIAVDLGQIKLYNANDETADATITLENNVLKLSATLTVGEYRFIVPAGSIKNEYDNLNEELSYTFSVAEAETEQIEEDAYIPLSVESVSIEDGRQNVSLNGNFRFTVNKECSVDSGKIKLVDSNGEEISLTVTNGETIVYVSYSSLKEGTTYTLTAEEGFLFDEKEGVSPLFTANFTTVKSSIRFFWTTEYFNKFMEKYQNYNVNFYNNAILNSFNEDVSNWLRLTGQSVSTLTKYGIAGNYWGTTNEEMIGKQILDFDDYQSLADLIETPYLTTAPENVWPFVTSVYILNSNGERVDVVGNETVTFVVEFNRDMDQTSALRVRFGSSKPYAEYEITGNWVSARRWEGTYTLKTTIENGNQYFNILGGCAASDSFMKLYEHAGRFRFEIDTVSAQALIMQAEATEEGINLTWTQDDFDTLLGFNIYRSDKEDGLYTRLNDYVLAPEENEFFDNTVEPGKMYYYNFTVVQTDMQESTPSGKVVVRSMDTMAPNIYHSPVRTAYTGKNLIVSATITDNLQITDAKLYYRVKDGEWKVVAMYNNNSRYYGVITAEYIVTDGLEYYIDAFDGITHTYNGSADSPYQVTVKLAVDTNSLGDVDGDGIITNKDALMLLQAANDLLNLTDEQFLRADLNGDGELSASEAMKILQYVSGKISSVTD